MAEGRLDIVIFGATGFTGQHVVKEAARLSKVKGFTWGVAGRRKEALEALVGDAGNSLFVTKCKKNLVQNQ